MPMVESDDTESTVDRGRGAEGERDVNGRPREKDMHASVSVCAQAPAEACAGGVRGWGIPAKRRTVLAVVEVGYVVHPVRVAAQDKR